MGLTADLGAGRIALDTAVFIYLIEEQLRAAAQLRAATGARTPDAIQLVAALGTGCTALVTNGRRLPPVPGLRVVQLESYATTGNA